MSQENIGHTVGETRNTVLVKRGFPWDWTSKAYLVLLRLVVRGPSLVEIVVDYSMEAGSNDRTKLSFSRQNIAELLIAHLTFSLAKHLLLRGCWQKEYLTWASEIARHCVMGSPVPKTVGKVVNILGAHGFAKALGSHIAEGDVVSCFREGQASLLASNGNRILESKVIDHLDYHLQLDVPHRPSELADLRWRVLRIVRRSLAYGLGECGIEIVEGTFLALLLEWKKAAEIVNRTPGKNNRTLANIEWMLANIVEFGEFLDTQDEDQESSGKAAAEDSSQAQPEPEHAAV